MYTATLPVLKFPCLRNPLLNFVKSNTQNDHAENGFLLHNSGRESKILEVKYTRLSLSLFYTS